MTPSPEPLTFVAILVFEDSPGRRAVEPHTFCATHPEVAYRRALARAAEQRHGLTFVGLAELAATTTDDAPDIGRTEPGDARDLVRPREQLSAFRDPRWIGVSPDPTELDAALREPPALADLPGLADVDWGRLSHAYGPALDVPTDLKRLASSDAEVRATALWQLSGSIYHQGDVFDSTAEAVPFLVELASNAALPSRTEILDFLAAIAATAAAANPDAIRKAWAKRQSMWPAASFARSPAEMAEAQIASASSVQAAFHRCGDALRRLAGDPDPALRRAARQVLEATTVGPPNRPAAE